MRDSIEGDQSEPHGLTLRQWIEKKGPLVEGAAPEVLQAAISEYVKCAIPVALKLTEGLREAEREQESGRENPIPLESIAAANVVVRSQEAELLGGLEEGLDSLLAGSQALEEGGFWDELAEEDFTALSLAEAAAEPAGGETVESVESVESVEIVASQSHKAEVGSSRSRLFALGVILCELFSRQRPHSEHCALLQINACNGKASAGSNHGLKDSRDAPFQGLAARRSKPRRPSTGAQGDIHSNSFPSLQFLGIPHSLCSLIRNLLDCCQETQAGDSYKSFADVHLDLKLMVDDPAVFLDNIKIGSLPSLSTSDKIYGREEEVEQVKKAYQKSMKRECAGVLIMGDAGVGKSKLAMYAKELTTKGKGYFFSCKFDQNQDIKPLSVIGSVFDKFCETVGKVASEKQQQLISKELRNVLGDELAVLIQILPNLAKILPINSGILCLDSCVDSTRRIKYLLCILVKTLSSLFWWPVTFFLDDLQWADPSSLLLVRSLLRDTKDSKNIFFVCCFRDKKVDDDEAILTWHRSIPKYLMTEIYLKNLDPEKTNRLISAALQQSPRLTFPLASVLHSKTRGNPFFLKLILETLIKDGLFYFSLERCRWLWNLDSISDLKIADNVVTLLMEEIRDLPRNLQSALSMAACMGGIIDKSILKILSKDVQIDLEDALSKVANKGFIDDLGTKYRFVHDRIQQAAYEVMQPRQRVARHMRFGLAICVHVLDSNPNDNDMFFIAVNQINRGGPSACKDSREQVMVASLNLKAGKRAILLSDFASALKFFEHGISFFDANHWKNNYSLSLELFDATIEAACNIGNINVVKLYADAILSNASCFEDKYNSLFVIVKTLRQANLLQEAKEAGFDLLQHLGEKLPLLAENNKLQEDVKCMKSMLAQTEDDFILALTENRKKKSILLMKLYHELMSILQSVDPSRITAVSLRMVQLSLFEGLCFASPLAFAYFGITLISLGDPSQAYRLGTIALKLLEKGSFRECVSSVIAVVHGFISWIEEPVQLTAQAHLHGYKAGKLSGDILYASMNYQQFLIASYAGGQSLPSVRKNAHNFIQELTRQNQMYVRGYSLLLYSQVETLIEGQLDNSTQDVKKIDSSLGSIGDLDRKNRDLCAVECLHKMTKALLFRKYDDMAQEAEKFDHFQKQKGLIRMFVLVGIFYQGLISFCMARRTSDRKWLDMGKAALSKMKHWSDCACWNFENKFLLLQSEILFTVGDYDSASESYQKAIVSAHDHKFVQEEGLACELAGIFYLEQNARNRSMECFVRSRECYQTWGSDVLVNRIESVIRREFGNESFLKSSWDEPLFSAAHLDSDTNWGKKRRR